MVAKKITSLQHPLVKHWFELRTNKAYREEHQRLLVVGRKMAEELSVDIRIALEPSQLPCREEFLVTEAILKKITGLQTPDGFAAEIDLPQPQSLRGKKRVLILDQLSDPGNLGTLLRTALALGWEGVVVTPGTVDIFNDKALRAAKGAHFHLPYARLEGQEIAQMGWRLYTADIEGTPVQNIKVKEPMALILSSEGQGVRSWSETIAEKITIPMHSGVESLNVAASGAILLYEMRA